MMQSEEKKLLIESMKKLVTHVSNNPQRQKQIFQALALQDLNKIIQNLKDDNQYLRRVSALLLCQLLYQSPYTKNRAVQLLEIYPRYGRICLGGIPQSIHKYPSTLKKCIDLLQAEPHQQQESKICWVINLERKTLKMEFLDYKKYSSFTFIDPLKNLFGFTLYNSQMKKQARKGKDSSISPKTQPIYPQRLSDSPHKQTILSNEFYKNYIEYRNRSKQPKRYSFADSNNKVNLSIDVNDIQKKIPTSRPTTTRVSFTSKRQDLNSSLEASRPNTIQSISQYARNVLKK